nr:MAG TPA: hypothetical protein [Bacteriophage sp.]
MLLTGINRIKCFIQGGFSGCPFYVSRKEKMPESNRRLQIRK